MAQQTTNILVTGASSYAGARIYTDLKRNLEREDVSVVGTYHSNKLFPELRKLDLTDSNSIRELLREVKPTWIVHIAAIPNQASCEKDIEYAKAVNVEGIRTLVNVGNEKGSRLIFISSESVYEDTLYGRLKKQGEDIARQTTAGCTVIQPAMIFGLSPNTQNDRPYNRLLRAIEKKQATSFDSDLKFFPTWLGNLSEVVTQVIKRSIINETIPVVSERLCSRSELASKVLAPFGIEVSETHSGNPGSNAPLTQQTLKRLNLPAYTADEAIGFVTKETLQHFGKA